jgi:hypothetical protein
MNSRIRLTVSSLSLFAAFSFGNTLDDLELFVLKNKSSLPTAQQLKSYDFTKIGTKVNDRKDFEKKYGSYLTEYDKIFSNYKVYDAVRVFTAVKIHDYQEDRVSSFADANNPTYMAFALLTGAGIDYEKIGDRNHIHTLARSYGVSDVQIENGIWQTLTRNWEDILGDANNIISQAIALKTVDKTAFMSNAMLPYLTLLSRGRTVPTDLENKIWDSFGKAFPYPANSSSVLTDYISRFKEYVSGTPMENSYMIKFNQVLKLYHYRLSMDLNSCAIYSIFDTKIPVDTLGVSNIIMQKRVGISLIGFEMGEATYADSTIALTSEYITDEANDIRITLSTDSLPKSFKPAANGLWKNIGLALTVERANNIYRALLRKEFNNIDRASIVKMVIRDVSAHEMKHKYDEAMLSNKQRVAMDAEISAHLAEAACGGIPIYALFAFINRIQSFYTKVDQVQIKTKLKPLIIEAWNLAINAENGKISDKDIVTSLKLRYSTYMTLTGYKLPSLGPFENVLIKKHLQAIPDFKLE